MRRILPACFAAIGIVAVAAGVTPGMRLAAQQPAAASPALDPDDIGGVVSSVKGPEAGVWVIAETTDLPTRMIKSVVTDDQGRYVIPDLPPANYQVFVRGYGLTDSPRVAAKPGQRLDLKAVIAPDPKTAAQVYPANYWMSLIEVPKGDKSEQEVVSTLKGCLQCHQLGSKWTRELPTTQGSYPSSLEHWDKRVRIGPSGGAMAAMYSSLGGQRKLFAEWTDRIAAGAYPRQAPPRPRGVERNVVITQWDWAWPTATRADSVATNEEHPQLNANGRVYGVYTNGGQLAWLDPKTNTAGAEVVGAGESEVPNLRSLAMDDQGRIWFTANVPRGTKPPDFCTSPDNRYAAYARVARPGTKQVVMYDPKTGTMTRIPMCGAIDHNHLGQEPDKPLYYGASNVVGWLSTATWDKTRDPASSQGWCPTVLDTNGDGRIGEWTDPDQPLDPKKDRRLDLSCYSIAVSPLDGSLWCSGIGEKDNQLVRIERGNQPPQSCKAEIYRPPGGLSPVPFFKTGGTTVDSNGVAWIGWRGSDQLTSFDRRKCKSHRMTDDSGAGCPEGWAVQQVSRPLMQGTTVPAHAELQYLMQMDRHDVLGLGRDSVIAGPVNADSLQVLVPKTGQFVDLVVPYPLGFFSRSSQGRIDDPNGGWKGRGLWSNGSTYTPNHMEGGSGQLADNKVLQKAVRFQMRPNPLAK